MHRRLAAYGGTIRRCPPGFLTNTSAYSEAPDDYAITAYDGVLVIVAALKKVVAAGKAPTRENVRAAIAGSNDQIRCSRARSPSTNTVT